MILGSGQVEKGGEGVRPPIVRSVIVTAITNRTETQGKSVQVACCIFQSAEVEIQMAFQFGLDNNLVLDDQVSTVESWTISGSSYTDFVKASDLSDSPCRHQPML